MATNFVVFYACNALFVHLTVVAHTEFRESSPLAYQDAKHHAKHGEADQD